MNSPLRQVRIARKTVEAIDICSFDLVALDGQPLPSFSPGSHIDVHVAPGLIRQYSLCNHPQEAHRYQIAVLLEGQSRGGSAGVHALQVGQTIAISEPKNHFELAPQAKHSILLAGGIGITPLLCMAQHLASTGASFELHYCARTATRAAFVEQMKASPIAPHLHLHFDDGPAAQKLDATKTLGLPRADTHVYVCGPTGFMDWVLQAAGQAAWPEAQLHREYFAAAAVDTSADGSFEVQIASTGAVITVAKDQTIVAALANIGIELATSCEQGVCGTCLTRVLQGTPDHRDMFLTPEEQAKGDQCMPCCSRSKSARLVLDL